MIFKDVFYQRIATLIAAALLIYLIYALLPVLMPFIIALVLAYLFNPIAKWLGKYGVRRPFAIVMVFTVVGISLVTAMALLIPTLLDQFEMGKNNMPKFIEWLNNDARPWVAEKLRIQLDTFDVDAVSASIMDYFQKHYNFQDAGSVISKIATSGMSAIGAIGLFVLVPVVAFFFMLNWEKMIDNVKELIPLDYKDTTLRLADECHAVVMSFVKGQMLVMLLLGLFYALCLEYLVGLDTGLFIGFTAGLASIVPYLGFIIGIASAVIACIVQFGFDLTMLAAVAAVFGAGQLLEGYGLQPFLLGDRIGLSPVMVIFAVLVGGKLLGLVGMLIGLPIAAVLMVLFRYALAAYKNSDFYKKTSAEQQSHVNTNVDAETPTEETTPQTETQPTQTAVSQHPTNHFAWIEVADTLQQDKQTTAVDPTNQTAKPKRKRRNQRTKKSNNASHVSHDKRQQNEQSQEKQSHKEN